MQKDKVLIIILILTIFLLGSVLFFTGATHVNRYVVSEEKWNKVLEDRTESDIIYLKNISFNDYPLIVDDNNDKLYYSLVENTRKYNPTIKYFGNENQTKVILKDKITEETIKNQETIEVMIYNNQNYRIYELNITKNPIINVEYNKMTSGTAKGEILVIDNQVNANQKIIRTSASITINNDQDYIISMRKQSVGRNNRKNDISVFGITMDHEFTLVKEKDTKDTNTKVDLFVNNEYQGVYRLDYNEQRGD